LIVPANIPGDDLQPAKLEQVASSLRAAGTSSLTQAEVAERSWAGLPAVVESPQGPTIYGALGTPTEVASAIEGRFDRVSDALDEFAAALRSIKQTFAAIKADAVAFRNTITADERVWVSPSETKEYEFDSQARVAASRGYVRTSDEVLEYLRGRGERARLSGGRVRILVPWTQSSEHIDQNNALMDRLADAYTRLQNAEADCANAINRQRDLCVAEVEHIEAWQLKQSGENTVVLPWGSRVDEDRNCGESFWWGAGNAGKEALVGAGGLIGYNGTRNDWSWDQVGQSWVGAVQGLGSLLVITSPPLLALGLAGVPVLKEGATMGQEMIKGLLAWDTWAENPAEASGRVLVNIGSLFIPGAGEVAAAIKALSAGSRIVDLAGDAARLSEAAAGGLNKLDNLLPHLDGIAGDVVGTGAKVDDLVTVGGRIDMPDSDVLHVGTRTTDTPATPGSFLDDGPSGTKPHTDEPTAPHTPDADTPSTTPHTPETDADPPAGAGHVGAESDTPGSSGHADGASDTPGGVPHSGDADTTPGGTADEPSSGGSSPRDSYTLANGSDYTPTTGRETLRPGPGSEPILAEAASRYGLTMSDLHHLIYERPVQSLTHAEARVLLEIRESVPLPQAGELMQKVLSEEAMLKLINRGRDETVDQIGGFLSRAADGQKLETAADYYHGYGLDYIPESGPNPFLGASGNVSDLYAVRFRLPEDVDLNIPNRDLADRAGNNFPTHRPSYYQPEGMGPPGGANPYLGNGFVGKGDLQVIPEYHVPGRFEIGEGAEVWRITANGDEVLVAVRIGGDWERAL
jgi:hypothetical protein